MFQHFLKFLLKLALDGAVRLNGTFHDRLEESEKKDHVTTQYLQTGKEIVTPLG